MVLDNARILCSSKLAKENPAELLQELIRINHRKDFGMMHRINAVELADILEIDLVLVESIMADSIIINEEFLSKKQLLTEGRGKEWLETAVSILICRSIKPNIEECLHEFGEDEDTNTDEYQKRLSNFAESIGISPSKLREMLISESGSSLDNELKFRIQKKINENKAR
jgi:hypothetical protein